MDAVKETKEKQQSTDQITNKSTKNKKSKTITKKVKDKSDDNESSVNHKRKLELINDSIDNSNNSKPKKKRKLNDTNNKPKLLDYIKNLNTQNKKLRKERDEYKKGMNHYKEGMFIYKTEMNNWKTKFIELHKKIVHAHTESNVPKVSNSTPHSPLPTPCISNTNTNTNTNNSLKNASNNNRSNIGHKNKHKKHKNKACKFDIVSARLLDMGFDIEKISNALKLCSESMYKDTETVFNKALQSLLNSEKSKLKSNEKNTKNYNHNKPIKRKKKHVRSKKDKNNNKNNNNNNKNNKNNNTNSDIEYLKYDLEFENSYDVSINCYICKKHYDDINLYRDHIKKHYENDSNKTWKICDLGCPKYMSQNDNDFIAHIAKHKTQRAFKCKMKKNGNKCNMQCSTKSLMNTHWKSAHNTKQKTKIKRSIVKRI